MDPDRKGAPFKVKCNSSDLFTKDHIKEIADSIENMKGEVVNQTEFKSWDNYLSELFIHVEDIVAFKLMVISNKSLSTFQEINFLKIEKWEEYLNNNTLCNAYDGPISLPKEFLNEYAFALPQDSTVKETELKEALPETIQVEQSSPEIENSIPRSINKSSDDLVAKTLNLLVENNIKIIP